MSARSRRPSAAALAGLLLFGGMLTGCDPSSNCTKACARVARCQDTAINGEPVMGSRPPPPDPQCMTKCKSHPDDFAVCEGKKRTCRELRLCRGAWQP